MSQTVQKQQHKQDDKFTRFIESKNLHEGVDVEEVSLCRVLNPIEHRQISLQDGSKNLEVSDIGYEYSDINMSQEDISYTLHNFTYEDTFYENVIENTSILGQTKIDTNKVDIVHKHTGDIIKCEAEYAIKITFTNELSQEKSVMKTFSSKSDAKMLCEKVRENQSEIRYDNGIKLNVYDDTKPSRQLFDSSIVFLTSLSMILTSYAYAVGGILSSIIMLITTLAIILIAVIARLEKDEDLRRYEVYRDVDGFLIDERETEPTSAEEYVSVTSSMTDDAIILESEEIGAKWRFCLEENVLRKDDLEFLEENALSSILDEKTTMRVSTSPEKNSIESVGGNWYLCGNTDTESQSRT